MEAIESLSKQLISNVKDQMTPSADTVRRRATDLYREWDMLAKQELLANMETDDSEQQTDTIRFRWRNARDVDKKPALQCRRSSYVSWVWIRAKTLIALVSTVGQIPNSQVNRIQSLYATLSSNQPKDFQRTDAGSRRRSVLSQGQQPRAVASWNPRREVTYRCSRP